MEVSLDAGEATPSRGFPWGTGRASGLVVGVGVAGLQLLDHLTRAHPNLGLGLALVVGCQCLPLAWLRRDPWWCWCAVSIATQVAIVASFAGVPTSPWTLLAPLLTFHQLSAAGVGARKRRIVFWASASTLMEIAALGIVAGIRTGTPIQVILASVMEAGLLAGLLAGAWRLGGRLAESQARVAALAQARTAIARQAVIEERARLARDLHDVAAHHLSSLVAQVEALRARLPDEEESVTTLAETGRQALDDMRVLLGILHEDGERSAAAPTPTMRDLPDLLDAAARNGEQVGFELAPEIDDLPTAVSTTAYRVIQESLTNARRHAPGAPVYVHTLRDARWLRITVTSDASSRERHLPDGSGKGLTGMAERVRLVGGRVTTGPDQRGWTVSAQLPADRRHSPQEVKP